MCIYYLLRNHIGLNSAGFPQGLENVVLPIGVGAWECSRACAVAVSIVTDGCDYLNFIFFFSCMVLVFTNCFNSS